MLPRTSQSRTIYAYAHRAHVLTFLCISLQSVKKSVPCCHAVHCIHICCEFIAI